MRRYQLRTYRIEPGRMDDFVSVWRSEVVPLRRAKGFDVLGAWVMEEENRFVWIISYEGPLSFEKADRSYYDSDERKRLEPDPAQWIVESEHHVMRRVELP